jgi:hypothetical protein
MSDLMNKPVKIQWSGTMLFGIPLQEQALTLNYEKMKGWCEGAVLSGSGIDGL